MEATHDLDFMLWCLEPRKPIRIYAQAVEKEMIKSANAPDHMWMIVTMDDGFTFTVGAGWIMPEDDFTETSLATQLQIFLSDLDLLPTAAARAREASWPDAAERLADATEALAKTMRGITP